MFDFELLEVQLAGEVQKGAWGGTAAARAEAAAAEAAAVGGSRRPLPAESGHEHQQEVGEEEVGGSQHAAAPESHEKARQELDEERWRRLVVEPPQQVLAKWARSQSVRDILGLYVLEDIVGGVETIQFRDVYRLLEAFGLSPSGLVARFADVPRSGRDVQRLADHILSRFASGGATGAMRFRDLFRLLEVLGVTIRRLLAKFSDDYASCWFEHEPPQQRFRFGSYIVSREIGCGFHGPCCYMAEHHLSRARAAVKWPVRHQELATLEDIQRQAGACHGLPVVLESGTYSGGLYVVTELLGSTLSKVFDRLAEQPLDRRWAAVRVVGRLLVRRLEAVHACGYVHCDVSPENVLLGRARARQSKVAPYLIDFGLARKHPGGPPLSGWEGSNEWSSIRSADGGRRLPQDDLEAVGWVLASGLFGELPWFEHLAEAYGRWGLTAVREAAAQHAKEAKVQLLEGGWDSHGGRWRSLGDVPSELDAYLKVCRASGMAAAAALCEEGRDQEGTQADRRPDYVELLRLLGGSGDGLLLAPRFRQLAEEEDLRDFQAHVVPFL